MLLSKRHNYGLANGFCRSSSSQKSSFRPPRVLHSVAVGILLNCLPHAAAERAQRKNRVARITEKVGMPTWTSDGEVEPLYTVSAHRLTDVQTYSHSISVR